MNQPTIMSTSLFRSDAIAIKYKYANSNIKSDDKSLLFQLSVWMLHAILYIYSMVSAILACSYTHAFIDMLLLDFAHYFDFYDKCMVILCTRTQKRSLYKCVRADVVVVVKHFFCVFRFLYYFFSFLIDILMPNSKFIK